LPVVLHAKNENITEELNVSSKYLTNKPTILVVEDNQEISAMIYEYVTDRYTVLRAYSAEEALEILDEVTVSLVVTDIILLEMDGIQFISALKQHKQLSQLPIIIISAKVTT